MRSLFWGVLLGAAMIFTVTARVLADDLDCNGCNKGQCVEPVVATGNLAGNTNIESSSTTLGGKFCDCKDTGFVGEHCELPCSIECQNGGKCVASEDKGEDGEHCSCSKAVVDGNPFVGLRCEFGATKSCMALGSESKHSFCTNGGDCQDIVTDNEQHKDCICEARFEGPHCEYVLGSTPKIAGASAATYHSQVKSTSDMVVFAMMFVAAALIGILLLAFSARARRRRLELEKWAMTAIDELSMTPTRNQPENDIL